MSRGHHRAGVPGGAPGRDQTSSGTDHNGANNLGCPDQTYATHVWRGGAGPRSAGRSVWPAFAAELNHQDDYSIELSAVWLHYTSSKPAGRPAPCCQSCAVRFTVLRATAIHPAEDEGALARSSTPSKRPPAKGVRGLGRFCPVGLTLATTSPWTRRGAPGQSTGIKPDGCEPGDHARFTRRRCRLQDRNRIGGFSYLYHAAPFV